MKRLAIIALAASAAIVSVPAAAQSATGTITLNGSVAAKCAVTPSGDSTFSDTVNFGELAQANGTLKTTLASTFGTHSFSIACNTGAPKVSVNANPLATTATDPDGAGTGYDNSIDYTASVAVLAVGTNNGPFTNDSDAAAGSPQAVGSALQNTANNVSITTSGYHTDASNSLLVADPTYTGTIVVVVSPS